MAASSSNTLRESATFEARAPCAPCPPLNATHKSQISQLGLSEAKPESRHSGLERTVESQPPASGSDLRSSAQHPGYIAAEVKVCRIEDSKPLIVDPPISSSNDKQNHARTKKTCCVCAALFRALCVPLRSNRDKTIVQHFSNDDEASQNDVDGEMKSKDSVKEPSSRKAPIQCDDYDPFEACGLREPTDNLNSLNDLASIPHPHDERVTGSTNLVETIDDNKATSKSVTAISSSGTKLGPSSHMFDENSLESSGIMDSKMDDTSNVPVETKHFSRKLQDHSNLEPEADKSTPATSTTRSMTDDPSVGPNGDPMGVCREVSAQVVDTSESSGGTMEMADDPSVGPQLDSIDVCRELSPQDVDTTESTGGIMEMAHDPSIGPNGDSIGVCREVSPQVVDTSGNMCGTMECGLISAVDASGSECDPPHDSSDEDAVGIEELERTVDMIMWRLREATPPEQRHKVFIEQCRAWHPDKNSEDLRKATIAFQRLQSTRGWFLAKDGEYVRQPDDPDLL